MRRGDIYGFPHHRLRLSHKSLHCAWWSKQDGRFFSLHVRLCVRKNLAFFRICIVTLKVNEYPLVTKRDTHTRIRTCTHIPIVHFVVTMQRQNKAVLLRTQQKKKNTMKWTRMSCDMCACIMSWISMSRARRVIFSQDGVFNQRRYTVFARLDSVSCPIFHCGDTWQDKESTSKPRVYHIHKTIHVHTSTQWPQTAHTPRVRHKSELKCLTARRDYVTITSVCLRVWHKGALLNGAHCLLSVAQSLISGEPSSFKFISWRPL